MPFAWNRKKVILPEIEIPNLPLPRDISQSVEEIPQDITFFNYIKHFNANNYFTTYSLDTSGLRKILLSNIEKLTVKNFEKVFSIDDIPESDISKCLFLLCFYSHDEFIYHIDKIKINNGKFVTEAGFSKKNYIDSSKNTRLALYDTVSSLSRISHYNEIIHGNICQAIEQTKHLEGDYIEIGVYKGGSALTALNYLKHSSIKRKVYLLDTFHGFDYEESKNSSDILWDRTHTLCDKVEDTIDLVSNMLSEECPNIPFKLIANNICSDSIPNIIEKIVVANIDVDLLEATSSALEKVSERLVVGGIIISEDPTSSPGLIGAYYAMRTFLDTEEGKRFICIHVGGQYYLIKMK